MPTIPSALRAAFDRFVTGPTLVRQAVAGLDAGGLNRRPPSGDWSVRDVIIHLADSELVAAVSFRLIVAGGDHELPAFDPDLWKRRLHYLWRDPEGALSLFQQTRYATAELLQQCDTATWQRTGHRPERAPMTLADLLLIYAGHAEEHAAQITSITAMSR